MHDDQLSVPADLVRGLIGDQFPQWAGLAVREQHPGTVNAVFRIGDDLVARFPLRPGAADDIPRDLDAARLLAAHTRVPVPRPVAVGAPGRGYPLPWSVLTWLPGALADDTAAASEALALDLADFIADVRGIPTDGKPFAGTGRGGRIAQHDDWIETCLDRSQGLLDVPRLRRLWTVMRELPRGADPDVMCHADLMPGNVLVEGGRLAGVLDVGGLGPADPALELIGAWHLLDPGPRAVLRARLGCGEAEWARGRAWAFVQSMGLVWYYEASNPPMARTGRRTLGRILADPA
ncbi:aminoglycoside phosphotransferase family protein [Dactylosporangium sp. CS-047395]|uniref:aminoglycoside phosphotransferase family protein n=1 Tax=Dactylosporangium sp. CS-047395 TaxID=3239936 RepID=UPI003D8F4565